MIYVFGNSHAHFFTDSFPGTIGEGEKHNEHFRSFSLGPVIAYNFVDHHFPTMVNLLNSLPITPNDPVLITIGEVDCRWHLLKQAEIQKRNAKDVVHECIDRFFTSHIYLKDNGYKVVGWGGHPSTTSGHCDTGDVVYGDCLTRNKITLEWNDYLEQKCRAKGIIFTSIVKDLINVDGLTKIEYYKDYCHLDSAKYLPVVIEKFKEKGLICGVPQKI